MCFLHLCIARNRRRGRPRRRWTDDIKQWIGASVAVCPMCTWQKHMEFLGVRVDDLLFSDMKKEKA